ncbi:MAG TPA: class I SAM-dependent methyltransferase [Nocardioidaceae bacterium]|nr:class I SAM-dependent methyltransferase [Nocardioidaceae bacterium]
MSRWTELSGRGDGDHYAARFDELAASGADVHGEASLCDALCAALVDGPARIVDAGCGTGRVAIELARRGHVCTGVDSDASMLSVARRRAPELTWVEADLADLDPACLGASQPFDLVVAAGNVIPLLAAGTEPGVVSRLAAVLRPGGLLVAGFGLDAAHLPLPDAPVDLAGYDGWCADAGLELESRFATWDREPYECGGYAVSVHRLRG